jgi:nucleoid-associated protein YgaU
MTRESRLGLVLGLGLVMTLAALGFRRAPAPARAEKTVRPPSLSSTSSPAPEKPAAPRAEEPEAALPGRRHVVREGETLYSLARQYYGDDRRFWEILRANPGVLTNPELVPPGTVLIIPYLPASP